MTPEVLEKAMTPFFTTKTGDTQGAGLGLYQEAEVARAHGDNVALKSAAGRGSTVPPDGSVAPVNSDDAGPVGLNPAHRQRLPMPIHFLGSSWRCRRRSARSA